MIPLRTSSPLPYLFGFMVSSLVVLTPTAEVGAQTFIRGDTNEDGLLSIADFMVTSQFILFGGDGPTCPDAADINDDGLLNVADPLALISFLFGGAGTHFAIPGPYPDPGQDPTSDALSCGSPLGSEPTGSELPHEFFILNRFSSVADDQFAIAPGTGLVSIPLYMSAQSPFGVEGFAISLSFDPTIVAEAHLDFSEGAPDDFNADLRVSHVSDVDPGRIYGYVVMELIAPYSFPDFPVGEDQLLGYLNLRLHDNVVPGTTFDIQFSTLPPGPGGAPIRNEIVKSGGVGVIYPYTYPVTIPVRPEEQIFIRGDLNRDGLVSTVDGFELISFLYSGSSNTPPCLDAGDVNDDGTINLADAIVLLGTLFTADSDLRPANPYPYQGVDGTEDSIQCQNENGA